MSGGPNYSQSLIRGLKILGCFTSERPILGIADIADDLGMSRSTAHRYVITLVALGYLEQGASRKYRLAPRATDLGRSALDAMGLGKHAHPDLEELCRVSGYTVSLAVLNGTEIVIVDRGRGVPRGRGRVDLGLARGSRLPAYCTATGKVLLAHLSEDEREEQISTIGELIKRGPNTLTSKSALYRELERVSEAGLAVSNEELAPGLRSIGAPVCGEAGEVVAALGMVASSSVISQKDLVDALGPHLVSTADNISARLGHRRQDEL
jgi:IclR family pca regulon transcriptional regulator